MKRNNESTISNFKFQISNFKFKVGGAIRSIFSLQFAICNLQGFPLLILFALPFAFSSSAAHLPQQSESKTEMAAAKFPAFVSRKQRHPYVGRAARGLQHPGDRFRDRGHQGVSSSAPKNSPARACDVRHARLPDSLSQHERAVARA